MQWKTLRRRAEAMAQLQARQEDPCPPRGGFSEARVRFARGDIDLGTPLDGRPPSSLYLHTRFPVTTYARLHGNQRQVLIPQPEGPPIIESDPTLFEEEFGAVVGGSNGCDLGCFAAEQRQGNEAQQQADQTLSIGFGSQPDEYDCIGLGDCAANTLKVVSATESAIGCRASLAAAAFQPPAGVKVTDQFTGRCMNTEFFDKRKAYADPEQFDDSSGCPLPTREDLYVVRFVNSAFDAEGNSTRTPMIFEVDQCSGLLAPTAQIDRLLLDDDFDTLDPAWTVVDSRTRPNHWEVGPIDGQTSVYVTATPGENDYLPGDDATGELSIVHLWRDIYFPTDVAVGSVIVHLRVLGNGNVSQPTNDAQDFASIHLLPTTTFPRADQSLGFENRLEGLMLVNRISSGDFVTERLALRTNVIRGPLGGNTYRLALSFHSGSGLPDLQPMALAVSRILVCSNVQIPNQPPVAVSPCNGQS